jgi:hypothetical protein
MFIKYNENRDNLYLMRNVLNLCFDQGPLIESDQFDLVL